MPAANVALPLVDTAVTPGSYDGGSITVDSKGRLTSAVGDYRVSAKTQGAVGDDTTDDRAALMAGAAAAYALGAKFHLPKPTAKYKVSKYLDFAGYNNLRITGDSAVIRYASDDVAVTTDATATSVAMARSAILLRYCTNTTFEGVTFEGGTSSDLSVLQQGSGVYATHCVNTTLLGCNALNGRSIFVQDALVASTGTGDSIAVSAGIVTLTDAAAAFVAGHEHRFVTIAGATNESNNGKFKITARTSSTVTYANADAVNETSSFTWEIDDNDRITKIIGGYSYGIRGNTFGAHDFTVNGHTFEHPDTNDATGIGDSFTLAGTVVTLKDFSTRIKKTHVGKYIKIAGSTSAANDGLYLITGVTIATTTTPAAITYVNASGVTELFTGTWWIPCGEKTGIGNGASALAFATPIMTLTSSTAVFTAADVGRNIRIANATTSNNNGLFTILSVTSSSTLTYSNVSGASETFAKTWTIDSYDRAGSSSAAFGASHFIYGFAGRTNWKITNCTFLNCREVGVKFSGSSSPMSYHSVNGNTFIECAGATLFGADDSQEHTGFQFCNNTVIDCSTGRVGWATGSSVSILGSRNVSISNNNFHYTRNSMGAVDGRGVGAISAITASRLSAGISQPCEDVDVYNNRFTCDMDSTAVGSVFSSGIIVGTGIGLRAHYRTGGTLTNSATFTGNTNDTLTAVSPSTHNFATGQTVILTTSNTLPAPLAVLTTYYVINLTSGTFKLASTLADALAGTPIDITTTGTGTHTATSAIVRLTDTSAAFTQQLVGRTIAIVNSASGNNDITNVVVDSVPSSTVLTYTNAAATTSNAVVAGTYRIWPGKTNTSTNNSAKPGGGGGLRIYGNYFDCASTIAVQTNNCVGTEIYNNTHALGSIQVVGDVNPWVYNNRLLVNNTGSAMIRFDSGTSWPVEFDNKVTNTQGLTSSVSSRDWGIGVDSTTVCDYPLLGKRGRVRPSGAYEECVVAYGSSHVDGDTILVVGTTLTYKTSSPSATQFNSFASFLTAVNLISGATAADYGTGFSSGDVTTQHARIRRTAQSSADAGTMLVRSNVLNPTALVILRNHASSTAFEWGRGAGTPSTAGPIVDKTPVWSPCASFSSTVTLVPDTSGARAVLEGAKAMGRVVFPAKANLVDTETITIGDGINAAKVYEIDTVPDGVTAGRVVVDVSGATTAADVAAIMRTAILANQPALSVSDNYGDLAVTAVDTTALLETLTIVGHKLVTGDQVMISNAGGGLPAGLAAATYYWVIVHTCDKIALATTLANAQANTRINITTAGTGTHTIRHGGITITHNWPGAAGNVTITKTVAHADCVVSGMSKGSDGGYRVLKDPQDGASCALIKHARNGDFAGNNSICRDLTVTAVDTTSLIETLTIAGHGLVTGDQVTAFSTTTLPAGLAIETNYWVVYDSEDTIALATTWTNAMAGTRINLTDAGTGTHTVRSNQVPEFRWSLAS